MSPDHVIGERVTVRFAWTPVRVGGRWLWWRDYIAHEARLEDESGWPSGWITIARALVP